METFIFTFTEDHPLRNHYQPIVAESAKIALARMFERYGRDWGFCYTEEQAEYHGIFNNKTELNPMYCKEGN